MTKVKKWVIGIALILGAICTYLIATLDNDPATKPNMGETIDKVKQGVEEIRKTDESPQPEAKKTE
jgi:hypothetical protein